MNLTADDIERIVREVLVRLTSADAAARSSQSTGNELTISERLVTLRDVEQRLTGVTKIHVGRRTVVTPSVRDLLRQKKIELVRSTNH